MPLDTNKIPSDLMEDLVGYYQHPLREVASLSADEAFDAFCTYNGLINWGPKLRVTLDLLRKVEVKDQLDDEVYCLKLALVAMLRPVPASLRISSIIQAIAQGSQTKGQVIELENWINDSSVGDATPPSGKPKAFTRIL